MKTWLIRSGVMVSMFACVYIAHALIYAEYGIIGGFIGGMFGGAAFVIGDTIIRRPE